MKYLDDLPICLILAAIVANIAIGVKMNVGFSALMIRTIVVIIVFGLFGHMGAEILKNAVACSRKASELESAAGRDNGRNGATIDFKVPSIDDSELSSLWDQDEDGFIEMNPVDITNYKAKERNEV